MKTRNWLVPLLFLFSLLSACATIPYNHMAEAARAQLNEVDAYLVVSQDEIYAQIDQSNVAAAGGGGLLLALIDAAVESSRTKTAEEMMQPIRDKLLDFDYANLLAAEINSALKGIDWLHAKDVVLLRSSDEGQVLDLYNKSGSSAVLFMYADYSLSPNLQSAVTKVSLVIYPKSEALSAFKERDDKNARPVDLNDNIYRNNLERSTVLITDPKTKIEDAAAEIDRGSPAMLVNALTDNARNIGKLIQEDISTPRVEKAR